MYAPGEAATRIKEKARELGFLACGIAKADFLTEDAPRLEQWLRDGKNAQMGYMANHFDMRLDPRKLMPGAKSVISLAYNYFTAPKQPGYVSGNITFKTNIPAEPETTLPFSALVRGSRS